MTIVYLGIAWLIGIWLGAATESPLWFWLLVGIISLLLAILFRQHKQQQLWLLVLAFICLGSGRTISSTIQIDQDHISFYINQAELSITGLVNAEPDIYDRYQALNVTAEGITVSKLGNRPVEGLVRVIAPRYPPIKYGTRIRINGYLEPPGALASDSYSEYLARKDIFSQMMPASIDVLEEGQGNALRQAILAIKSRARATIQQMLPDPEAALLTGILLGDDSGLPAGLEQEFRTTGLTHIIAISGFNIAILAAILLRGSRPFVGFRGSAWVALGGVAIYTVLVGADAAVVRAAIMGGLFIFATRSLGRPTFAAAGLFTAALVMTLANPNILWDVGFQLSFAATLGLMLYVGPWQRQAEGGAQRIVSPELAKRGARFISDIILATLAAMLLTMPLIIYHFQQLSLISLLANIFVLPAQAGIMAWGLLATVTGMIFPPLGQALAWVTWLFLNYTIGRVRFFASVPAASVPLSLSQSGLIAAYLIIFSLTWLAWIGRDRRHDLLLRLSQNMTMRLALAGGTVVAILAISWAASQPDGRLHISFLDVGQGDATFIQTPSGRQILIDGGAYPTLLHDHLGREIPFWDRDIDLVIATHPDTDHVAGLPGVFDRYRVSQLMTNGQESEEASFKALNEAAAEQGTNIHKAMAGEVISIGDDVRLEILSPSAQQLLTGGSQHDNDSSVCLRLVYKDFSLLLTGDASQQVEGELVRSGRSLSALLYKAGHHGSKSSSSRNFLEAIRPQYVVISSGAENRYGHPHEDVLERVADAGAAVLRTDELGTIEVVTDGQTMWWLAQP